MTRPKDWTEDQLANGVAAELMQHDDSPLPIALSPKDALNIASLLLLASRHPEVPEPHVAAIHKFVDYVSAYFEGLEAPYCLEALRRGLRERE